MSGQAKATKPWLALIRSGDWLVLAVAASFCATGFIVFWSSGPADWAIVRLAGDIVEEVNLKHNRHLSIAGPLGTTVVAVENRRVRVVSDPGNRQYCVLQGWISRPGEVLICAPNQVSVRIGTQRKNGEIDSLAY